MQVSHIQATGRGSKKLLSEDAAKQSTKAYYLN